MVATSESKPGLTVSWQRRAPSQQTYLETSIKSKRRRETGTPADLGREDDWIKALVQTSQKKHHKTPENGRGPEIYRLTSRAQPPFRRRKL